MPSANPSSSVTATEGLAPDPSRISPPFARDRSLHALLVLCGLALLWAWWRGAGYQLADSVEYMERARAFARHEELIDNRAIRAFGFSGLLLPLFLLAELFGIQDTLHVLHACQFLQIGLSLCLVAATARWVTLVAGRAAGWCAGLLVGFNPIVLRWGVEPVSGIAAALFVVLALSELQRGRGARSGALAGLWLGLGGLMAYQTFSVVLVVVALVVLRDVLFTQERAHAAALFGALCACIFAQCLLDLAYYGQFGVSVLTYFLENVIVLIATITVELAKLTHSRWLYDLSSDLYKISVGLEEKDIALAYQEQVKQSAAVVRRSHGVVWYLQNLARGFPWAAVALFALGSLRALLVRRWTVFLALAIVLCNAPLYGLKGSKDFRLWLPFLPAIALVAGLGAATLAGAGTRGFVRNARVGAAALVLLAAAGFGLRENLNTRTQLYGGFWRAMEWVNGEVRGRFADRPLDASGVAVPERVSATWHWSVFLRQGREVELVKLPHHLDYWPSYTAEERAADLTALESLDWFIAHLPALREHPEVLDAVNRLFGVRAAFWDRTTFGDIGPILVFERRWGDPNDLALFDVIGGDGVEAELARRELDPTRGLRFVGPTPAGGELVLLDYSLTTLPGDGHAWITYTWLGGAFGGEDWTIVDRLTSSEPVNAWQNNHEPAYGRWPTSRWGARQVLREGYLVVAESEPFRIEGPRHIFGGEHRRGELAPARLWVDVAQLSSSGETLARLEAQRRPGRSIQTVNLPGRPPRPDGAALSEDGLAWVGGAWLWLPPAMRWPDDGSHVAREQ